MSQMRDACRRAVFFADTVDASPNESPAASTVTAGPTNAFAFRRTTEAIALPGSLAAVGAACDAARFHAGCWLLAECGATVGEAA